MEKKMENYKEKGKRLSRRFSSRKSLGSLKTRFKRFISDHAAKAGEAEDNSSAGSSGSDTDGRTTSSPNPDRSGEIKKSSGSGFSSDSDGESPSKLEKKKKPDSSPNISEEKKREKRSSKSSRKKLELQLQEELSRLPPLEETPPTSPQSNPRFSTGALSDYGRLWTHVSAPNSPANLAHNLNVSYRGGDSSPVALVHSLSARERGKHPSQLSEISYASPPSSSSLDLDSLGEKLEDMKGSPSKTTPSLNPNGLPIVHHDEEQGVWRCGSCGFIYPNPNPSLRNRREHKKHCGEINNVQRWLGEQDMQDAPGKGAFAGAAELEEDSEALEGSGLQETLSTADQHPMGKFDRKEDEVVSDRSGDHHGPVDHGRLEEMETFGSLDHDAVVNEGNGGRSPSANEDPDEFDEQRPNRVLEWSPLDAETEDHSSPAEILSNSSTNHNEDDHSKMEDLSIRSPADYGTEEVSKLDDSASLIAPEVEKEKEEPVEVEADQEEVVDRVDSSHMVGSEVKSHESQLNQKSQEEMEEAGDVHLQPVNAKREEMEEEAGDVHFQPVNGEQEQMDTEAGDAQVQPVNGKQEEVRAEDVQVHPVNGKQEQLKAEDGQVQPLNGKEKHNSPAVNSNGHGFKEEGEHASHDFSGHQHHPDDFEIPEHHIERSVPTSDSGVNGGQGIDDLRNKDELDNQIPGDDDVSEQRVAVKASEMTEPKVLTHTGRPIVSAEVVPEPDEMEPSLSGADLQSVEPEIENRHVNALEAVAREGTNGGKGLSALTETAQPQDGKLETEQNVTTNGNKALHHSSPQNVSESETSTRVLPSQENGIRIENGGRTGGTPTPLEEPPKWVNSVMITSQDEADTFSSRQKYWADVTRSEYLLVEGKRSPSFGSCDNIGFPSFRNGEGRRSPSPFSLSKSEDGEVQSSQPVVSVDYHSPVEGKIAERDIRSLAAIHHDGSSSSSAHLDYDLEKVVYEQMTHDLICPICGSDVTKRIILRKRKRTRVPQDDDGRTAKAIMTQPGRVVGGQTPEVDESDDETWGCLACFSYFIRRGGREEVVPAAEEEQASSVSGKPVETEQERVRCLPTLFRWGYVTSEPELQAPFLGDTASEEVARKVSEHSPVSTGQIHEVPLDDDEEVSCFSYLQRPKSSDIFKEEGAEIAESMPVSTGEVQEVPLDEDEQVSCFSHLQRFKREPLVKEATDSSISNLQPEAEAPNISEQVEVVGEHGDENPDKGEESIIQRLDEIGVSHPRETAEAERCECLPFFSFRSESTFSVKPVTDTGSSTTDFHREEGPNKEGTSESLPESVPAFPWGASSKYDLPPSPGVSSSHQEITSVIDKPEEASTSLTREPQALVVAEEKIGCHCLPVFSLGTIPVYTHPPPDTYEFIAKEQYEEPSADSRPELSTREPQALEDAEEKGSCNCLPAFSWGPTSEHTHPLLDTDETAEVEQQGEAIVASSSASVSQDRQQLGDAEEKGTCNCLPDALSAVSWGPIPVFTHPPPDTYEFVGEEQHEEPSASIPSASETQEPQGPEVIGETRCWNCLPELLPTFSWRSNPVSDREILSSPQGTTGRIHEVPLDDDDDDDVPSSQLKAESKQSATCSCLPLLLPAFHWGFTKTTYEPGLREPLLPPDPPAAEPARLDDSSTGPLRPRDPPAAEPAPLDNSSTHLIQTTESQDPVVHRSEEGVAAAPAKSVTAADPASAITVGEGTQIIESEEFHVEGIASSQKTVTKVESGKEPVEVLNVQQSTYHFEVDIKDGNFTGTVEKLQPRYDTISSIDSSSSSAGTTDGPEQALVESRPIGEEDINDFKHVAHIIAGHLAEQDVVPSPEAVTQSIGSILSQTFPAEEAVQDKPKYEPGSCNCLPLSLPSISRWRLSGDTVAGEGLQAPLLGQVEESQSAGRRVDMAMSSRETHVEVQSSRPSGGGTGETCNCLPLLPFSFYDVFREHHVYAESPLPGTEVDDTRTPLLGTARPRQDTVVEIDTTETNVAVGGAPSAEAAAAAIATARGQTPSKSERLPTEYLKSIVHGGLDVTLFSLGVVASGAGGDAKTLTVVAIGLANLLFGLIKHLGNIMSLFYNNFTRFQEEVGQGFINGFISSISFAFFGLLAPITYGFSFRNASNHYPKFAATCVVALIVIVLLGAAKANVNKNSYVRVISILIVTGFVACIVGYETGNVVSQVLEQLGFSSV
ncbi:unnamed protein product [Calypogeia fissa]